jgi:hypothetical protein
MDRKHIDEKKQRIINERKQMLKEFVDGGGILENLTIKDKEYIAVKNLDIYVNGRRLSLEERFDYLGFPRKPQQKPFENKLNDIKEMLDDFVAQGGNVDEIDISHPIYVQMRAFTPVVNGKKLTIEEKFELAGHPRKSKINDMELFYNRLCELESFKDENGYVDSYRKDDTMKGFLSYLSIRYDLPMSLVICLLGDQKLQKHVVVTDRIQYLKKLLTDYLAEHKNFIGIRRLDPKLYHFLTATSKAFPTPSGKKLRNLDLIELLGFEDVDNGFAKDTNFVNFSEELFMKTYMPIIRENGGVISLADIDHTDNYRLNLYLRRKNETKAEFFARYNVKLLNPRILGYGKKVILPEYPYMDEMQEELNNLLADIFTQNPELQQASIAKLFEIKVDAVRAIYAKYKDKIEQKHILNVEESTNNQTIDSASKH